MKSIILASESPRRLQLLKAIGFNVQVESPFVDESALEGEDPQHMVIRLAELKANTVAEKIRSPFPIVSADTVVCLDDHVLGKPINTNDAVRMLNLLSGKTHEVVTGYCVRLGKQQKVGFVTTLVTFRHLSNEEITAYVETGEPLDKAGAYGIQANGASLTDHITGSYTNVMGLPMTEVLAALRQFS